MNGKEALKELRTLDFRLNSLEEAIMVTEAKATKVTSSWSDMPGGGVKLGIDDLVCKLVEQKSRYIEDWNKLLDKRIKIESFLTKMENTTHAALLWLYYVRGKNWEQVAETMSFSISYVFTMHGLALQEFNEIWT